MDFAKILKEATDKNKIPKFLFMLIGVFLLALNYNLFFVKNELVIGGMSGLAIVFNKLCGLNNQIFIYITSFGLLLVSFKIFGIKGTKNSIIGSLLYPFMVSFTAPLADLLATHLVFEDFITTITLTSILHGIAGGLVYKMGYNTGGSDIIVKILMKYLHMSDGKAIFTCNLIIILFGGIVLGVSKVIYAIIILYISSLIVDKIQIGISKCKMFIIQTKEAEKVEDVIINELKLGVTVLQAKGGYSNKKQNLLMCVVPTKDYLMFKEIILAIDKDAFCIINDCYDTEGGMTKKTAYGLDSLF